MKFLILLACFAGICYASVLPDVKQNSSDHRIVNGDEIDISAAPYHVSIQTKSGDYECAGTIISSDEVLTTASCASMVTPATHQIRYDTDEHNWGGIVSNIISVKIPPTYQPGRLRDNVGIIRILDYFPSRIYNYMAIRCTSTELDKIPLKVAGWGYVREQTGQLSSRLRQVELPYAGNTCARYYAAEEKINVDETMFCAGNLDNGGTGICTKDFGGGAIMRVGSTNVVLGVASHFYKCGAPKLISLFSRVSSLSSWIQSNTYNNVNCNYQ